MKTKVEVNAEVIGKLLATAIQTQREGNDQLESLKAELQDTNYLLRSILSLLQAGPLQGLPKVGKEGKK